MKTNITIILILVFSTIRVLGEEKGDSIMNTYSPALAGSQGTSSLEIPKTWELRGSLRELGKVFTESPAEIDLFESRLELELISTLGKNSAFRALGYTVYQYPQKSLYFDFKEAYIDFYTKYVDFRFGRQIISWGKADELNPTDILNPQNMNNITEDKSIRKIGLFQPKVDFKFCDFVLTGIWKPEFEYFDLPPANSRWSFYTIPGGAELPAPTYPDSKLKNTQWAVKLARTISSIDFTLSYFDGWDNIYSPIVAIDTANHQVYIDKLITYRTKMVGADFATSIASIGFWGEGAYFITEDKDGTNPTIKNPYIQYVLGADYEFRYKFKLNIQYFQEVITRINDEIERTTEEAINSKLGIGLPLQQALTFRLEKKFGLAEEFKAEIFGIYDIKDNGIMFTPKFFYSPEDGVNLEAGYHIFAGDDQSFWNRFQHNDEVYLKCTYSF